MKVGSDINAFDDHFIGGLDRNWITGSVTEATQLRTSTYSKAHATRMIVPAGATIEVLENYNPGTIFTNVKYNVQPHGPNSGGVQSGYVLTKLIKT